MLEENQVDTVIVTTMDRTHHRYIIRAMKAGCDCITEKPMTVPAPEEYVHGIHQYTVVWSIL